jgi:hypothetical protein
MTFQFSVSKICDFVCEQYGMSVVKASFTIHDEHELSMEDELVK